MQRFVVFAFCVLLGVDIEKVRGQGVADALRDLDGRVIVLGKVRQQPLAAMLPRDAEARIRMANETDRVAWAKVNSREDWERFRNARLVALRQSLGIHGDRPKAAKIRITKTTSHAGIEIDHLIYETRPGIFAASLLFRSTKSSRPQPAIVLVGSHFGSKSSGVHQDMALTWARVGCAVFVPDHLGQGERRQHPFGEDDPHSYHFRHDLGMQLELVGESLMGWFVQDLMAAVDVLRDRPDVDPNRILAVSDPAGGGDVAAVFASLDDRLAGAMVQNFGGPEPEDAYPLPRDAERSFNFAGLGSWESTRNLRNSARDGFLPWSIVASIAPRKLIYYHEFYWDASTDPVWKRLKKVYGLYEKSDSLIGLGGRGFVVGSPPENTHWLPENRALLYPVLERWFGIPNPKKELSDRLPEASLVCWMPELAKQLQPRLAHAVLAERTAERLREVRAEHALVPAAQKRESWLKALRSLIGSTDPEQDAVEISGKRDPDSFANATLHRLHLQTEPGIVVPTLLFVPSVPKDVRVPVVLAIAQGGKQDFLKQRSSEIASLLLAGIAVCLPDLRGTGETQPGESRERRSQATDVSATHGMVGDSLLAGRVRDLRALLRHVRKMPIIDANRVALWGDSFAPANAPDADLKISYVAPKRPALAEPMGGLAVTLAALHEPDVKALLVRGGLCDFLSAFESPFVYLPHDAIVPGILSIGDVPDLFAALAPLSLRVRSLVNASNRLVPEKDLPRRLQVVVNAYNAARAREQFDVRERADAIEDMRWLALRLKH